MEKAFVILIFLCLALGMSGLLHDPMTYNYDSNAEWRVNREYRGRYQQRVGTEWVRCKDLFYPQYRREDVWLNVRFFDDEVMWSGDVVFGDSLKAAEWIEEHK